MTISRRSTLSAILIAGSICLSVLPAKAFDLSSLLQDSQHFQGYLSQDQHKLAFSPQMQATLENLNKTSARLRAEIDASLSSGRISVTTAADLRDELTRLSTLQNTFIGDGMLSFAEAQQLTSGLGQLESKLSAPMATSTGGTTVDFDARIRELGAKITAEFQARRLTTNQAHDLRHDLDQVIAHEANYDDSGFSPWERNRLESELDRINNRLNKFIAIGTGGGVDSAIEARIVELENRITTNLNSGTLSTVEARELRRELRLLSQRESAYDDSGYSTWERRRLLADLDRLNARLNMYIADQDLESDTDIETRIDRLSVRISSALTNGQITAKEARELQAGIHALEGREELYDDSGYNTWERSQLLSELGRIESRLNIYLASDGGSRVDNWASFQSQQNRLRSRIDLAMQRRQVSANQAQVLRSQLYRLSREASLARSSGGYLSSYELSTLKQRQNELSRRVSNAIAVRTRLTW